MGHPTSLSSKLTHTKRLGHPPDLLRTEVVDRVPATTEAEARILLLATPSTYRNVPEDQAVKTAMAEIQGRRTAKLRAELVASLRKTYSVTVLMEPPRLTHLITEGQSLGEKTAAVKIIEFSDFQCPFCSDESLILERLSREYPSQVQLIFKNFPLPMHQKAAKAAAAAWCAGEQKRFWPMHDVLFSESRLLARERFDEIANRAELDPVAFNDCINSHRVEAALEKDKADGTAAGVTSTPTMFINGQLVAGAKSYEELKEIVTAELRRLRNNSLAEMPAFVQTSSNK